MNVPIRADLKVGENAVEKLVDAALDAFSPATESLGLLGDAVRLARVEVATAITRRAKAIADEQGLRLIAPPLKFLIPFYEKASTEEKEEGDLVEMWARLLASAGVNYSARHVRYASILSEMSGEQARILDEIARNFGGVIGEHVDADDLFYRLTESRLVGVLRNLDQSEPDKLMEAVLERIAYPGVSIVIIMCEMAPDGPTYDWTDDAVYDDKKSIEFEILKSLGLLEHISTDFISSEFAAVTVGLYRMTEMGFDLWKACGRKP